MSQWVILLIFGLLTAVPAWSAEVIFLEYHQNGKPVQLEPGGRFFHVAIRFGRHWLQAHPHGGVALVADIQNYGQRPLTLIHPDFPDPTPEQVARWIGKPFDYTYAWDNPEANYCSRLVAEILGVPPQPMTFVSEIWKDHFHKPEGEPGLSPDKLFAALKKLGFVPSSCEGDLVNH